MKVATIVGARPQFIKVAPVSRILRQKCTEVLVHTGQHYDNNMSAVFFEQLDIPAPDYNLGIGSGSHGAQTGAMLAKIEDVLLYEKPDWVLTYGDTNSTLAGALAAVKLHIKIAHVEAGLRSFNRDMPEEINRLVTDQLSSLLFCPSQTAMDNLATEGITRGAYLVGDVMADALAFAITHSQSYERIMRKLGIKARNYLLATIHRAENMDDPKRLSNILQALNSLSETVVFPVHPRTRFAIERMNYALKPNILLIEPVGYLDMVQLEKSARMILTDSGGVQKEAYWLGIPCITVRNETEWVETVQSGWNTLVGINIESIVQAVQSFKTPKIHNSLYGDGHASERIVQVLAPSG